MKKLSETLTELGIAFDFPIEIKDANGNQTYREDSDGYCYKYEYDAKGYPTYYENSNGLKIGTPRSAKTREGEVVELDGVKYKLKALHITADCHEEGGEFFVTDQSGNGNHAKFNHSQRLSGNYYYCE